MLRGQSQSSLRRATLVTFWGYLPDVTGGEYKSPFAEICLDYGIILQSSAPYTPQMDWQNIGIEH